MSTEPLVVAFEVGVPPPRAFEAWTARCATWWPRSHTVSGHAASITFEPRAGGRIVQHAPDGSEHLWGEILDWEPPTRLREHTHDAWNTISARYMQVLRAEG